MQGQSNKEEFIKTFTGSHHFILEYLTDEVLKKLPDQMRQFLLHTSILKRLSGPLCDHVCEIRDSGQILQDLYHRNLFIIPLDEDLTLVPLPSSFFRFAPGAITAACKYRSIHFTRACCSLVRRKHVPA